MFYYRRIIRMIKQRGFFLTLKSICDEINKSQLSIDNRLEAIYDYEDNMPIRILVHDNPLTHQIQFSIDSKQMVVCGRKYMAIWSDDKQMRMPLQPLKAQAYKPPHLLTKEQLKGIITNYYLALIEEWYIPTQDQPILFKMNREWAIKSRDKTRSFLEQNQFENDLFLNFAEPREKIIASQ